MQKDQIIKQYRENQSQVTEIIKVVTIWSDHPNKEVCKTIGDGLHVLAKNGDKNAAALYCAITAYDNHADTFSKEIAYNLLLTNNVIDEYHALIEEEFYSIVDADYYEYLYAFPILPMFEELAKSNEEKTDAS